MQEPLRAKTSAAAATPAGADSTSIAAGFAEVLAAVMKVDDVPVDSHFFEELGNDSMVMAHFCARVRKRDDLPSVSMKDVYSHPTIRDLAAAAATKAANGSAPPASAAGATTIAAGFAEVLAAVMKVDDVPVDSHFFEELGNDSMVMAHFCARVRKRDDLPSVSMKDVYSHPTIRDLAAAFTETSPRLASVPPPAPAPAPEEETTPAGAWQVALCGTLQFLIGLGYFYLAALALVEGYQWISAGTGFLGIYARSVLALSAGLLAATVLPILAKWTLVGRWKPQRIPVWSLAYVRFWVVKTLVRANPAVLFAGTPIYVLYLRALGAKIGRRAVIQSIHVPVCTDLLTIGEDAVVRKDCYFNGYRARDGRIEIGSVHIGRDAIVGELTSLDIDTSLGDGAQLGHSSSLHAGQSVPDGEHRQGSPARQRTEADYRAVDPLPCGTARRVLYSLAELAPVLVIAPLVLAAVVAAIPLLAERPHFDPASPALTHATLYLDSLIASLGFFFGAVIVGLLFVVTVPRLLNLALKPGKAYPLYGFHYWAHRAIGRMTNLTFYTHLFGDSSYIVNYLQWIGYDLSRVVQTGSNFGLAMKHDNPFLVFIGSGTMVADGLSVINADYSSTSFRVSRVAIGADNFLGNFVAYPPQGKTGDNCLLGTKLLVPVDGEIREGVGLLGSPSFEIPRTVLRDSGLAQPKTGKELRGRLRAKNRYNLVTMALFLLVHWLFTFGMSALLLSAADLAQVFGPPVIALALVLGLVLRAGYYILVERASTLFRSMRPQHCSIYDSYFWYHERYWKLQALPTHLMIFDGTPLKGVAWRLLGARIGKRVFDDGSDIMEKTMVTIGDDCTFNMGSIIQPHSQEDGGFKSDRIAIGARCTLGVASWVHYGVTMGDGSQLAANAFLMKGEEVPPHARWGENPAGEVKDDHVAGEAPTMSEVVPWPETNGAARLNGGQAA